MLATKNVFERPSIKNFPVVYQDGKPTTVLVDINVFELIIKRLEELKDFVCVPFNLSGLASVGIKQMVW